MTRLKVVNIQDKINTLFIVVVVVVVAWKRCYHSCYIVNVAFVYFVVYLFSFLNVCSVRICVFYRSRYDTTQQQRNIYLSNSSNRFSFFLFFTFCSLIFNDNGSFFFITSNRKKTKLSHVEKNAYIFGVSSMVVNARLVDFAAHWPQSGSR